MFCTLSLGERVTNSLDIVEYEGAFAGDRFGARKHFEETLSLREFVVKG